MTRISNSILRVNAAEEGHAVPGIAALVGAAGAIILGIGAANDSGALAIAGGIVAGLGFLAASVLEHMNVDYDVFARLEKLEKK